MRCRYCGKELALLKRLTGGGEFCSEAHKQSYQEEYNRLALSRLLQAQTKTPAEAVGKHAEPIGKKVATLQATPVALEEPAPQSQTAISLETSNLEEVHSSVPEAANGATMAHNGAVNGVEAEPLEMADFLVESPAVAVWPAGTPYLEPWLDLSSGPAVADWQFEEKTAELSIGELLSLAMQSTATPAEHSLSSPALQGNLTPQEFTSGPGQPTLPWKTASTHQFSHAAAVSVSLAANAIDYALDRSLVRGLSFETEVLVNDSFLLQLPFTGVEFPAEDSDITLVLKQAPQGPGPGSALEDDDPQASLDALSRLHLDPEPHSIQVDSSQPPEAETVESALTSEPEPAEAAPAAGEISQTEVAPAEAAGLAEQPPQVRTPRQASELLELTVRMFPPPKSAPVEGAGLPVQSEPLLPQLKSLPLRPKMAVATGYAPPSTFQDQPGTAASPPQAAPVQATPKETRPTAPSKHAPSVRPSARISQPKQPQASGKVPGSAKTSEPDPAEPARHTAKHQPASAAAAPKPAAAPKTTSPATAQPETHAPLAEPANSAPSLPSQKESIAQEAAVPAVSVNPEPPATPAIEKSKEITKPAVKQTPAEPALETVPTFGGVQAANPSFAGSLKVKLGIAIVFLVIACSTWLGWGGKSQKAAGHAATTSVDGVGPNIIMGDGGWVEGWAGDPSGLHAGRQITMYRPSLQLSDYRIEFQGSIDTQSVGWVFRAADPSNYYALKLAQATSGLSPKLALYKYLVLNGRQTQVGRVPLDLTLRTDSVFSIRTDVRGPQFSTYIQGRQVDVWTDDQLKTGGVGFLNEREERGRVKAVSIRDLSGLPK